MMSEGGSKARPVRIVIADDHEIFRDGLRHLLECEPGLEVVGEASNPSGTVAVTRDRQPDILLLDVTMPDGSGLDALAELAQTCEPTRVILLTAAIDGPDIVKALHLGARGLVLKESATALLMKAIRTVMDGKFWVGHETVSDLVMALLPLTKPAKPHESVATLGLTARELQVTELVVSAAANKEIAERLGISEKTVKQHLTNIFDKVGVSNRVELALFAVERLKRPLNL
jgi:DNA-binding NarL/FixJ family response regulator